MTGTCYNFEMEEFFSSFLRRAGMPASAGLSFMNNDAGKMLQLTEDGTFYESRCNIEELHMSHWDMAMIMNLFSTQVAEVAQHKNDKRWCKSKLYVYRHYIRIIFLHKRYCECFFARFKLFSTSNKVVISRSVTAQMT